MDNSLLSTPVLIAFLFFDSGSLVQNGISRFDGILLSVRL